MAINVSFCDTQAKHSCLKRVVASIESQNRVVDQSDGFVGHRQLVRVLPYLSLKVIQQCLEVVIAWHCVGYGYALLILHQLDYF